MREFLSYRGAQEWLCLHRCRCSLFQFCQSTFLEKIMKKMCGQFLVAAAAMLAAASFTAIAAPPSAPGERTPNIQQFAGIGCGTGLETTGLMVAPTGQQTVKQRQYDPPMIKMLHPLGTTRARTPWLEASAAPSGITKLEPSVTAKSPGIPTLWDSVANIKKVAPAAPPDGHGIAFAQGGGSGWIDRMPAVAFVIT
jgi:hypothetical protein